MAILRAMTAEEYTRYLDVTVPNYAEEKVKAGNWDASDALERAKKEFNSLLPEGVETKNNYLYSILDEKTGALVGMIWVLIQKHGTGQVAYICDFLIYEEYRRKGYGEQGLQLLEEKVREFRVKQIGLHVFGHNTGAIELYKKLGYGITNMNMAKIMEYVD